MEEWEPTSPASSMAFSELDLIPSSQSSDETNTMEWEEGSPAGSVDPLPNNVEQSVGEWAADQLKELMIKKQRKRMVYAVVMRGKYGAAKMEEIQNVSCDLTGKIYNWSLSFEQVWPLFQFATRRGGHRTLPKTTDANLNYVFCENHTF